MKRNWGKSMQRTVSSMLALTMVLATVPTTVFATEDTTDFEEVVEEFVMEGETTDEIIADTEEVVVEGVTEELIEDNLSIQEESEEELEEDQEDTVIDEEVVEEVAEVFEVATFTILSGDTVTSEAEWLSFLETAVDGDSVTISYSKTAVDFATGLDIDITIATTNANSTYLTAGDITVDLTSANAIKSLTAGGDVVVGDLSGKNITGTIMAGGNVSIAETGSVGTIANINAKGGVTVGKSGNIANITAGDDVEVTTSMSILNGVWDVDGDVTIASMTSMNSANYAIEATGDVVITKAAGTISGSITANNISVLENNNNVTGALTTTGDVVLDNLSGKNVTGTVTAGGNVTIAETGSVGNITKVEADGNITLGANVSLSGTVTAGGDVTINKVLGSNAVVNATNVTYTSESTNTSGAGTINATGDVAISGGKMVKTINLTGDASLNLAADSSITAGLNMTADSGNTPSATVSGVATGVSGAGSVIIKEGGFVYHTSSMSGETDLDITVADMIGDGTEASPYEIDALYKLDAIRHDLDAHYILTGDIDATVGAPAVTSNSNLPDGATRNLYSWKRVYDTFTGTIDGNDATISNLIIPVYGLFDSMSGVTIENLQFENVLVNGTSNIHSLFGFVETYDGVDSTISNISIDNYRNRGNDHAAGIVGVKTDENSGTLYLDNIHMSNAYVYGYDGTALLAAGWAYMTVEASNCTFDNITMPIAELSEENWGNFNYDDSNSHSASLLFMHKGNPEYSNQQNLTVDDATVTALLAAFAEQTISAVIYDIRVKFANKETLTADEYAAMEAFVVEYETSLNPVYVAVIAAFENMTTDVLWYVTLDANGGTATAGLYVTKGEAVGTLPTPVKSGSVFQGWYVGDVAVTSGDVFTEDTTLTASWRSFSAGGSSSGGGSSSNSSSSTETTTDTTTETTTDSTTGTEETTTVETSTTVTENAGVTTTETVTTETTESGKVTETVSYAIADTENEVEISATITTSEETTAGELVATATNEDATSVTLSMDIVSQVASQDESTITVETSEVSVSFDNAAVTEIGNAVEDGTESMTIVAEKVDISTLPENVQEELADALVVDLTVYVGENKVSDFGDGTATITVPYTKVDDSKEVVVYYVSDDGEMTRLTGVTYNAATGMVTFTTNHFSYYAASEMEFTFTDVTVNDDCFDGVLYVYESGIMAGISDTEFGPDMSITRGMIAAILYRLNGSEPVDADMPFTDVAADQYYLEAVRWAKAEGVVAGVSDTEFAPNTAITTEQFAAFLYRYANFLGMNMTTTGDLSDYADASDVTAYAYTAMVWAVENNIITGETLEPTKEALRGDVATSLMNFMEMM